MGERRVWIAQCLCPDRHCILACTGEHESQEQADSGIMQYLRDVIDKMVDDGSMNAWCGICGAKRETWRFEAGRTSFRTMREAEATLVMLQEANLRARDVLGGHPGAGRVN